MTAMFLAVVAFSVVAGMMHRKRWSVSRVRHTQMVRRHRVVGMLAALTILLPALANAHGNVAIEEDPCVRRVGGSLVHFNAYQPQNETKGQYCTDIPGEGDTFLVLDLMDPGLRNMPMSVRIVKGYNNTAEDQTVAYWPPAIHPDGVARGEAKLAKGLYTFIITPEGFSPSSYLLRVQQLDYSAIARKATVPLSVLLVVGLIGYELSKSKRLRGRAAQSRL